MIVFICVMALLGGLSGRICGGDGIMSLPRWLALMVYALPYGAMFHGETLGLVSFAAAMGAKDLAHTPYWMLGHEDGKTQGGKLPQVDPFVRLFFGPGYQAGGTIWTQNYWRDAFGCVVTGLLVPLLPGMLFAAHKSPEIGAAVAAAGLFKPVGYMIGWKLADQGKTKNPNIYGEFLTGALGWGSAAWAILS